MADTIKPNDFPQKSTGVDGTVEIYTQTGGINEKFLTQDIAEFINPEIGNYDYIEIDIPSAQILTLHTTPVDLLSAATLSANEYYYLHLVILEYTYNSIPYENPKLGNMQIFHTNTTTNTSHSINANLITSVNNAIAVSPYVFNTYALMPQEDIKIDCTHEITNGDGAMKVRLWYKVMQLV